MDGARREIAKDIGGALLFGMPLVYTMEVWWLGQRSDLAITGGVVAVATLAAVGMRRAVDPEDGWALSVTIGIRAATLSLMLAAIYVFVLGIVRADSHPAEVLGIIGAVGVPLTLGSVLGHVLFSNSKARDDGGSKAQGSGGDDASSSGPGLARVVFASAIGAAFLALPIAPTDEVPMIAANLDGWRAFATVSSAVVACYVVLIASGFLEQRTSGAGIEPVEALALTCTVVAVGLAIATALLVVGGNLPFDAPAARIIGNICALSVPAIIGAAAGRLVAA